MYHIVFIVLLLRSTFNVFHAWIQKFFLGGKGPRENLIFFCPGGGIRGLFLVVLQREFNKATCISSSNIHDMYYKLYDKCHLCDNVITADASELILYFIFSTEVCVNVEAFISTPHQNQCIQFIIKQ